jgi:serine/threonine protein kinase
MPKSQQGGKILGEGSYGCVFDKPLKCIVKKKGERVRSSTKASSVGKITTPDEAATEFSMTEHMRQAPNADKYFVLIDELCTPMSRANQTEPDLKKCEMLKEVPITETRQLTMPFAGRPLLFIPKNVKSLDFFSIGQQLLEAGALLLTRGVVHGDLHWMNIMIQTSKKMKIIDFGVAWRPDALTLSNLHELRRVFTPESILPPDFTYISGMQSKIPERSVLEQIEKKSITLTFIEKVFGTSKREQINSLERFVHSTKSIREQNWYFYYKLYWSKMDAWTIGLVLTALFIDLSMDPEFEELEEYKKKSRTCLKALEGLTRLDAGLRLDAIEALEIWAPDSPVLNQKEVQDWLKEQNRVRAELAKVL